MKQSQINAINILNNIEPDSTVDLLEKAMGHKYYKREGVPGNYKYYYTEAEYKEAKKLDYGNDNSNNELNLELSTEEQFCKNGEWDKNRVEKVHKPIIESYLSKVTKVSKNPVVTLMMGAPASGKGTVVRLLRETEREYKDLLIVNPDDIKQKSLKEDYEKFQKHNLKTAARMVHEESSHISKRIVEGLDKIGAHYLQDKCFSDYGKLVKEINRLGELGVKVKVMATTSSIEKAYQRMLERGERTGRYVEEEYFHEQHRLIEETFKKLIKNLPKNVILVRHYHNDENLKLIKQIENERTQ